MIKNENLGVSQGFSRRILKITEPINFTIIFKTIMSLSYNITKSPLLIQLLTLQILLHCFVMTRWPSWPLEEIGMMVAGLEI